MLLAYISLVDPDSAADCERHLGFNALQTIVCWTYAGVVQRQNISFPS